LINLNINSQVNPHYWEKRWKVDGIRMRAEGSEYAQEEYNGGLDAHSIGLGLRIAPWLNIGISANIWANGYSGTYFSSNSFSVYDDQTGEYLWDGFGTTMVYDEGNYTGTSYNFGLLLNLTSYLNVGLVYKTAFKFEDWDQNGNKKGEVYYPHSLGIGLAYRPVDNLTFAADITSTEWSKGKSIYGDEVLYFPSRMLYDESAERENKKQNNTNQLRFGAEYVFILDEFLLALRAGLYLDKQFFSDENLQIPTYTGIASGAGIVWKSLVFDVAINYEFGGYQADYYSAGKSDYSYLKVLASVILRF
jgi:long-subunit fatty acid transport protein